MDSTLKKLAFVATNDAVNPYGHKCKRVPFDYKIVNVDVQSYINRPVKPVLKFAATTKKTKRQLLHDR